MERPAQAPPLRSQRGAPATACPGLQPRQLYPHLDLARDAHPLVDDHLAGPAGEDRREDRPARTLDHLPDGRGHGLSRVVPADTRRHDGAPAVAARPMLTFGVRRGRTGWRLETCVPRQACAPRFLPTQRSTINRQGASNLPGVSPLLNARFGAYRASAAAKVAVHKGNPGNEIRIFDFLLAMNTLPQYK